MFACKNCGGNIIYDIKSGKLVCKHCQSSFDPENVTKENDSVDYDYFETTVFTCPQCGAAIMCEDNEASSFCTYCSSSTVLTSRISKEKKPSYIIPFTKTKAECIEEYKKITKKAIFAPSEFRKDSQLDKFKAIYMPYWCYEVTQDSNMFDVTGTERYDEQTGSMSSFYSINGMVRGKFTGICKDASYNFSDDLSERIAPFHIKEKKKFYPSYLSGFYADVSDVPSKVYEHEPIKIANDVAREVLQGEAARGEFSNVKVYLSNDQATEQFNTTVEAKKALFPVWFLSFKQNKKVAYVTVNGQTGKAASDLPVSIMKYLLAVLLATLVFFVPSAYLFFLFWERAPFVLMDLMLLLSAFVFVLYYFEIKRMQIIETDSEDAGKFYRKYGVVYIKNKEKHKSLKNFYNIYKSDIITVAMYIVIVGIYIWSFTSVFGISDYFSLITKMIFIVGNIVLALIGFIRSISLKNTSNFYGILVGVASLVITTLIMLLAYSYAYAVLAGGVFICIGCFMTVMDLIRYHNELSTRKPPYLKKRGGDVIADSYNM